MIEVYNRYVESLLTLQRGWDNNLPTISDFEDGYDLGHQLKRAFSTIEGAMIFEVDDKLKRACVMHKSPKNCKYPILPHKNMFIAVDFESKEFDGMGAELIQGILLSETPLYDNRKNMKEIGHSTNAMVISIRPNDKLATTLPKDTAYNIHKDGRHGFLFLDSITFNKQLNDEYKNAKIIHKGPPTSKFIANFVNNLLMFINDPDVQLIRHTRSEKNIKRRIRQGRPVIPDSIEVKLTGNARVYIDRFYEATKRGTPGWHYNYRFPVRQHIRRYRDKVTGAVIKETRVREYIKGSGPLVEKSYKLEAK